MSNQSNGLIRLNATGYEHFVVDYPRPYTMVILFSAEPDKFKCATCDELLEYLEMIIYSY